MINQTSKSRSCRAKTRHRAVRMGLSFSLEANGRRGISGLLTLALLALATPAFADGVIENVNGITLDQNGKVIRFNAVLVGKDGKVTELLTKKDKLPKQPDFRYDARGATMLPGLIDAHGHVMGLGFQLLTLDLSNTNSLAEAQAAIRDYAAKNPDRRWIVGRGWNQEKWGLGRFPTAADLDAAVSDRPVWLERVDGHAGWANSRAMQIAGVTAASKSPPGGRIELAGGRPSGIFVDAASELVGKFVPTPKPSERDIALGEAQKKLLSQGITAIADMGTSIEDWQSYRRAGDSGWLSIRIFGYAAGIDNMVAIAGAAPDAVAL